MKFTEQQWRAAVIYQTLLIHEAGYRLKGMNARVRALKRAIKHFHRNYKDATLSSSDVIVAARRLWTPHSRVERGWYYITNTGCRAVIGCSYHRAIIGWHHQITSWCNKYPMTKTASKDIHENEQEWLKKLGLDF